MSTVYDRVFQSSISVSKSYRASGCVAHMAAQRVAEILGGTDIDLASTDEMLELHKKIVESSQRAHHTATTHSEAQLASTINMLANPSYGMAKPKTISRRGQRNSQLLWPTQEISLGANSSRGCKRARAMSTSWMICAM